MAQTINLDFYDINNVIEEEEEECENLETSHSFDKDYQQYVPTLKAPTLLQRLCLNKTGKTMMTVLNHYKNSVPNMFRIYAIATLVGSGGFVPNTGVLPYVALTVSSPAIIESVEKTVVNISNYDAIYRVKQAHSTIKSRHIIGPLERLLLKSFNRRYNLSPPGAVR